MSAIDDIAAERAKQFCKGYDAAHDDGVGDALAMAAARLASPYLIDASSPEWVDYIERKWAHDRRQQLVIAAALLVAEIERLDREQGA